MDRLDGRRGHKALKELPIFIAPANSPAFQSPLKKTESADFSSAAKPAEA